MFRPLIANSLLITKCCKAIINEMTTSCAFSTATENNCTVKQLREAPEGKKLRMVCSTNGQQRLTRRLKKNLDLESIL